MQQDFVKVIRGSECIARPDLVPPSFLPSFEVRARFFQTFLFFRQRPLSDLVRVKPDFIRLRMHLNCQNLGNWRDASFWLMSLPLLRMEIVSIPSLTNSLERCGGSWTSMYQRKLERRGLIL